MTLLEVAVTAPVRQTYTYSTGKEPELEKEIDYIGKRVLVPFGRRPLTGYVLGGSKDGEGDYQIKPVLEILDDAPLFLAEQISFFRWIADYYHYPLGLVIKTALPGGLTATATKIISLTEKGSTASDQDFPDHIRAKEWIMTLRGSGSLSSAESRKIMSARADRDDLEILVCRGIASITSTIAKDRARVKKEICFGLGNELQCWFKKSAEKARNGEIFLSSEGNEFTKAEIKILSILAELQHARAGDWVPRKELQERYSYGVKLLSKLAGQGAVIKQNRRIYRSPLGDLLPFYPQPESLSEEQKAVLEKVKDALARRRYKPFLLHGVTGSGKTEVYLQAAAEVVASGRNVLVLVPEIALATQIEAHFISRFKGRVALLHSGLSTGERFDEWWRVINKEVSIVIGARSAVFAPLQNIGLIIVDEEHDSSFKQADGLRYNGRDLAMVRAQSADSIVILGSATPSIVSHYHTLTAKFQLLKMTRRIGERQLPEASLVDLKDTLGRKNRGLFHPELQNELGSAYAASKQSILLLNRRGFATSVICRDCGTVVECSHCKVNLNRHRQKNLLLCHYCGFSLTGSIACRVCGSSNLHALGFGTEKVEEEVRNLLPEANVARLDSDVAADRTRFLKILKAMRDKEIDVLVGTQMIAKGLHFPEVSLVGIVMADSGLGFPDFRAAEKTYQLITQVTGRAGRGDTRGKVVIQTLQPDHYAVVLAAGNDYEGLLKRELAIREEVGFPPYCRLVFIIVEDPEEQAARTASRTLGDLARQWCGSNDHQHSLTILGPAPAPIERLRDRYRWQILLKATRLHPLHSLVDWITTSFQPPARTRVVIDIDPENML